jgi:hypothetical protein
MGHNICAGWNVPEQVKFLWCSLPWIAKGDTSAVARVDIVSHFFEENATQEKLRQFRQIFPIPLLDRNK